MQLRDGGICNGVNKGSSRKNWQGDLVEAIKKTFPQIRQALIVGCEKLQY